MYLTICSFITAVFEKTSEDSEVFSTFLTEELLTLSHKTLILSVSLGKTVLGCVLKHLQEHSYVL